jgi:hypothetical protein
VFFEGGLGKVRVFNAVFDGKFAVMSGHSAVLMRMIFDSEKFARFKNISVEISDSRAEGLVLLAVAFSRGT